MTALRRIRPDDAPVLAELVERNLDSLRMWLPWAAAEPLDAAARLEMLGAWDREWDDGGDRRLLVTEADVPVGMVGLHRRGTPGSLELGYWLDTAARGRGVMTAAARLAVESAFAEPAVDAVTVRHDRANTASLGVARRLGFRFVDDRHREPAAPADTGREWVWSMTRRRWAGRAMTDGVRIRPMAPAERAAVIALWRAAALIRVWNDPDLDVDRKLAHSPDGLRVAELDGRLVGTAMVGYDGHRGWINYLAVEAGLQGRGIGRLLISDAEVWLAEQGCPKINLQVRTDNVAARELYRGLGYDVVDATALGRRLVVDDPSGRGSTDC